MPQASTNMKEVGFDDDETMARPAETLPTEAAKPATMKVQPEPTNDTIPNIAMLEGYRVSKKGIVINEDAEEIGRILTGEVCNLAGKKINEKGQVLDQDGKVLGTVGVSLQLIQGVDLSTSDQDTLAMPGTSIKVASPMGHLSLNERELRTVDFNEESNLENPTARPGSSQRPSEHQGKASSSRGVNILGLSLPDPTSPEVSKDIAELFCKYRPELDKLNNRKMSEIEKPFTCIDQAFEIFKSSEQQQGQDHLVKPSGSLTSKLVHLLNQPSFTTLQNDDNETADENNPCTRMIMENVFAKNDTMMMDYVHRRSYNCEDVTTESPLLKRHDEFTDSLLASSEAKIIQAYGAKVQRRLLTHRRFDFLPLWGVFEGVVLALEHEYNYSNADLRYRYRRIFLFAQHPNHLMWQQRGNSVLKLHDQLSQITAEMTKQEHLVKPAFFAHKRWSRDSPQRTKYLREAYKASQPAQILPLQPNSTAIQAKYGDCSWDTIFDGEETHNNKQLAEEVLQDALKALEGLSKLPFDWKLPFDLPLPVLRWIQGSRYALFGSGPVPDSEDELRLRLYQLAFPGRTKVDDLRLDKVLLTLLMNQQKQVSAILGRQDNTSHLLHSGVGQALQI